MLPSEAEMPPCAATVCERVGKHLGDAGGLEARLGAAERGAQARAAGADDDDVIVWSFQVYAVMWPVLADGNGKPDQAIAIFSTA
jgi:hypothetical protein